MNSRQLEAVHAWNQARIISYHKSKAREALEQLRTSKLCDLLIPECTLNTTKSFSVDSFENFKNNCPYLSRGYVTDVRRWIDIWDTTVGNNLYSGKKVEPQEELIHGRTTEQLLYATSVAMELVKQENSDVELHKFINSYTRHRGSLGQEFLLDLALLNLRNTSANVWVKRIALLFPFQNTLHFLDNTRYIQKLTSIIPVRFVVPISGYLKRNKLTDFMKLYYQMCIKLKKNCKMILVLFDSTDTKVKSTRSYLKRYAKKYNNFISHIVYSGAKFNRTRGYNLGMSILREKELAVLLDHNTVVTRSFLERCRQYSIRGQQIYLPNVFKYYNMQYIYPNKKWSLHRHPIIRNHGHWGKSTVICIFNSDFNRVGKFEQIVKWELEPELIPTTSNLGISVIQSPDPGVTRVYEESNCDFSMPSAEFKSCLMERRGDLGDKAILANYALSLEKKCKIKKSTVS